MQSIQSYIEAFTSLKDVSKVCKNACVEMCDGQARVVVAGFSGALNADEFYKGIVKFVCDEAHMSIGDQDLYHPIIECLKKVRSIDSKCDQSCFRVHEVESIFQSRVLNAKL